jgi:hypothetical protein
MTNVAICNWMGTEASPSTKVLKAFTQPADSMLGCLLRNVVICNWLAELRPKQGAKALKTMTKQSVDEVFRARWPLGADPWQMREGREVFRRSVTGCHGDLAGTKGELKQMQHCGNPTPTSIATTPVA